MIQPDRSFQQKHRDRRFQGIKKREKKQSLATVDGQNPAPPRTMIIPLFVGF